MTVSEAIEILQDEKSWETDDKKIDALIMAIESLEKQIPKTVYHFVDGDTFETGCCGIDVSNEDYKYCPECGQLLGKVEEVREEN